MASDGASNMVGKRNGLVTQLKKAYPWIVNVHCLAHHLELNFKDVISQDMIYQKLVTLLLGIYYFYRNSPKQKKELKSSFEVCTTQLIHNQILPLYYRPYNNVIP